MAADDAHPPEPANPEYAQWAHFKPGTYVTLEAKLLEHRENNVGVVEAMAHPSSAQVVRINTKLVDPTRTRPPSRKPGSISTKAVKPRCRRQGDALR